MNPTPTAPSRFDLSNPQAPKNLQRTVSIALIDVPDATNGRSTIDHARITNLAASIARVGLLNPITLREQGERYKLCAGLNRLRAVQLLNHVEIAATILTLQDSNDGLVRLAENAARSNLSPVEEAIQLAPLVEQDPNGIDGVAAAIGRKREWIDTRLEILDWPPELIDAVHEKKMPLGAAQRLAKIPDPNVRADYIYNAITHGINTRTAAEWLRQATSPTSDFFATPQGSLSQPQIEISTKSILKCLVCEEGKPLENTHSVRVCDDCLTALAQHKQDAATQSHQDPHLIPNPAPPAHR